MLLICLLLLFQSSAQLECDKTHLQQTVGSSLVLKCKYETSRFFFNKKYWCRGESKTTCEIVADTEGFTKADLGDQVQIQDLRRYGLFIWMRNLKIEDSGVYWAGIDKIYADIMYRIHIQVSEQAVTKPRVWFSNPPQLSCWGQPLAVHCASDQGTRVNYAWYQTRRSQDVRVSDVASLHLDCGAVEEDGQYYCVASNSLGSQSSCHVTAKLLHPAEEDCVYAVTITDDSSYDCRERLRTTTTAPLETTQQENTKFLNSSVTAFDQTTGFRTSSRFMSKLPLWYVVLRWLLLCALLLALCVVWKCSQTTHNTRPSPPSLCNVKTPHTAYRGSKYTKTVHEMKL